MEIKFQPQGVCSKQIVIDVEDGIVNNVKFIGGCSGNTQGVGALAKGMQVNERIEGLEGSGRWGRTASCADQLE